MDQLVKKFGIYEHADKVAVAISTQFEIQPSVIAQPGYFGHAVMVGPEVDIVKLATIQIWADAYAQALEDAE